MKKALYLLLFISLSCASVKTPINDSYAVINVLTRSLLEGHRSDKDIKYLYFRKDGAHGHFSSLLTRDFKKYFEEEEFDSIFKNGDLEHIGNQLTKPFILDFEQLKSKKIKPHNTEEKQEAEQEQKGFDIRSVRHLAPKDPMIYTISRPVFTKDKQWSFVYVVNRSGISIDILHKRKRRWGFYRMVPIGIF